MVNTTFIQQLGSVPTADEDTQPVLAVQHYAIVMTVVESKNPYLNGKQVCTPMEATEEIAMQMFHAVITEYEGMAKTPYQRLEMRKYKGVFNGQKVTLELVKVSE